VTASPKPTYEIPLMEEINSVDPNGYTAMSTFSGCGGSSLGLRWAGFKVLWASEFVRAARDAYRLNHPTEFIDGRDIRKTDPMDVMDLLGVKPGEVDVLEGSPPCASFSMAGKRDKHWGKRKKYSDRVQQTDNLFDEFARVLEAWQPRAFVAENVPGLVMGTAKGYFVEIMRKLKDAGYQVRAKVLNAQWLGVPQSRKRLIIVGARNDLGIQPSHPSPLPYSYAVRDALPWVQRMWVQGYVAGQQGWDRLTPRNPASTPSPTILAHDGQGDGPGDHLVYCNPVVEAPPAEASLEGCAIGPEWDKLPLGGQSPKYFSLVRVHPDKPCPTVTQLAGVRGVAGVTHPYERRKFTIPELRRICGFPDNFQLQGTYAQQWERLGRAVPPPMMRAVGSAVADMLREVDGRG
jgi:DNA (cytosine-5)-methyltransferase 1